MGHPWDANWADAGKMQGGGQGVTRKVTSRGSPNTIGVLKYLKNNSRAADRGRMRREVAALQSLVPLGAKVPRVLDHNTESADNSDVELFLVMDYIAGQTIKELVESNGKLPLEQAVAITLDVCATIAIGHKESLLHRDIKHDNIIIRGGDVRDAVVIDYGLSFNQSDSDLTQTEETFRNRFLDLPEANAPGGDRRDARSDVTAICGLLYYMLTTHRPGHLSDSSNRPPHLRTGYSIREAMTGHSNVHAVEMLLNRGLALSLENRFQTVRELTERLTFLQKAAGTGQVDPIATAVELSRELQRSDKKTRIAERHEVAHKSLLDAAGKVRARVKDLGLFSVEHTQGARSVTNVPGFDVITTSASVYTVRAKNHGVIRTRMHCVCLRGDQCFVLAADVSNKGGRDQVSDWKEITWYDQSTLLSLQAIDDEFMVWLDQKIREMYDEIVAGQH